MGRGQLIPNRKFSCRLMALRWTCATLICFS